MKIRELKISDWEEYLNLRVQLGGYTKKISLANFAYKYQKIKEQGSFIYVGIINNKIVATAKLIIEYKFMDNVAHIEDVVVDINSRKKGYGTDIIKYLVNISKTYECYKVVLLTKTDLEYFYNKSDIILTGISMTKFLC